MKTTNDIIDEIILKSPHGGKLWNERMKRKYGKPIAKNKVVNHISQIEDSKIKVEPIEDHPHQTYFNFEEGE